MGLFDGKIDLYVWCKSKFDKLDRLLLKFTSTLNTRSSLNKPQPLTLFLRKSNISPQPSDTNLPQFKINAKVYFLATHLPQLDKLPLKTVKQSPFFGNLIFDGLPQIEKLVNLSHKVRFLTIFAGEGG